MTSVSTANAALSYARFAATIGLCAVVALAPLPFASMDMRIVAVWILLLSAVLLLASLRPVSSRDLSFIIGFATISLAWTFVVGAQLGTASLPSAWLTASIWQQASAILGQDLTGSVSVARNQPFFAMGSQIACWMSMLCGYLVGRDRRAARWLLMAFLASALAYAVYGLFAFIFWPNYLLWHQKFNYLNAVTATFINPNVAASYFGAASVGWFLVFASSMNNSSAPLSWREQIRFRLRVASSQTVLHLLACFVVLAATMMTGSRAGSVVSLLCMAGALGTHFRNQLKQRHLLWVFPIAVVILIIGAISIFAPSVNRRFGTQGFFDAGRWQAYVSMAEIIKEYPWFGSGLGTFRWIFPAYRSGELPSYGTWEQGHNTTLEIASEMGIPFTAIVAAGWLVALLILGRGITRRNRDAILPTTAFWIGLLALVHSQVDFPLQIPGFSLAICPILGMGMAQSFSSNEPPLT
ncbi:O-antigen ligase family protein [Bradyrhizobium sp. F1.13.3]|uniref:O-antigen ligase family protein n=1 Tax=Bradyrhizobium sp. F1.13.3 TaxID=3156351 RepID=UPI0033983212